MKIVVVAVALAVAGPVMAQSSKTADQRAYEKCMSPYPKDVSKTYFGPQFKCSNAVYKACEKRTNDWAKCSNEDSERTRIAQFKGLELLTQESDKCMLEYTKAYAVATQESVQTVIDAAYTKCGDSTGPMNSIAANMTREPLNDLIDRYKKRFTATVMDARIKVNSGSVSTPETPKSKAF